MNLPIWIIFITFTPKYEYKKGNISDGNKI